MKWGNPRESEREWEGGRRGAAGAERVEEEDKKKMRGATGGDRGEGRGKGEVSSFSRVEGGWRRRRQHICLERDAQH